MPNRPARFTIADLRRATKAAEQSGPDWAVEIAPDGTIRLVRGPRSGPLPEPPKQERKPIRLW